MYAIKNNLKGILLLSIAMRASGTKNPVFYCFLTNKVPVLAFECNKVGVEHFGAKLAETQFDRRPDLNCAPSQSAVQLDSVLPSCHTDVITYHQNKYQSE